MSAQTIAARRARVRAVARVIGPGRYPAIACTTPPRPEPRRTFARSAPGPYDASVDRDLPPVPRDDDPVPPRPDLHAPNAFDVAEPIPRHRAHRAIAFLLVL